MKTKILIDGHCIDDFSQGTVTYIVELYRNMKHPDFELLFCSHPDGQFEKYFKDCSHLKHVPLVSKGRLARYSELNDLIDKYSTDFLHFQYTAPFRKKCKWINTLHDILFMEMPHFFKWRFTIPAAAAFWYAAKRSDLIITSSAHSSTAISNIFKVHSDRIRNINYGCPDFGPVSPPMPRLQGKKYFLYVGRVEPRKNHVELMECFLEYLKDHPGRHLVFVGAKNLNFDKFEETAQKLGDRLIHLQNLSMGELRYVYENAVGQIYPSLGEGFGFPVLESLSLGTPTVSTINTSLAAFEPYLSGIITPGDRQSFLEGFAFLEKAEKNSQVDAVKQSFNWKQHAEIYAEDLLQIRS